MPNPVRRVDPLAGYFAEFGDGLLKTPSKATGLFALAGGTMPKHDHYNYAFWTSLLKSNSLVRHWVDMPISFVPPHIWPAPIARKLDTLDMGHLEPWMFAHDFLPNGRDMRRRAIIYKLDPTLLRGMGALQAYTHGWPWERISGVHRTLIGRALDALSECLPFLLWAYNPNWLSIPMGRDKGSGRQGRTHYLVRLGGRARLESDPLSATTQHLGQGIGHLYRDPAVIRELPRRDWTPRSSRVALIRDLHSVEDSS